MKVYRISPEKAQVERSKALKRTAFFTAIALMFGFWLGGRTLLHERNPGIILAITLFVAVWLTVSIWWSLRKISRFLGEAYSSFEITADEQTWTKKQKNTPDVTLARSEGKRVEEWQGKGFRICTADRHRNIWVPCELDGYEQLRSEVLAVPGVTITKSAAWLRTYLAFAGILVLFAVSFLVGNKWISAGASLLIAAFLFFSFFKHFRNPNLTSRGRRQFLWAAFAGVCMVARAILALRS